MKANAAAKKEAKAKGETILLKRLPVAPREARTVSTANNIPQTLAPIPYGLSPFSSSSSMTMITDRISHHQIPQSKGIACLCFLAVQFVGVGGRRARGKRKRVCSGMDATRFMFSFDQTRCCFPLFF